MFMIFPSPNSKLVYNFQSLSLKPMQGNGVASVLDHVCALVHNISNVWLLSMPCLPWVTLVHKEMSMSGVSMWPGSPRPRVGGGHYKVDGS